MQNVCGTVNHFFKYRTMAGTAGGRLPSAESPPRSSSGPEWMLRRSRSWRTLNKSFGVNHVTECHRAAWVPERASRSPPQSRRDFPEAELGGRRATECHFASCSKEHAIQINHLFGGRGGPDAGPMVPARRRRRSREPRGWI